MAGQPGRGLAHLYQSFEKLSVVLCAQAKDVARLQDGGRRRRRLDILAIIALARRGQAARTG